MRQRIEALSSKKRALLGRLAAGRLGSQPALSPSDEKRIVAYLVCDDGNEETVQRLREALESQLPDYMVPSAFVVLDRMPLTPSGKVDRLALPDPAEAAAGGEADFVAPRSDAEVALAEIWADVLGMEGVGANDNFFELGGHSLLVNQVVARIRDVFEVDLPLRALFEAPTVAELAIAVEEAVIAEIEALPEPVAVGSTGETRGPDEQVEGDRLARAAVSGQAGFAGRTPEGKAE